MPSICCDPRGDGGADARTDPENNVCANVVLCAGCGGAVTDRYYLLAVDRRWHVRCLMCCECKLPLDSELTCFARDGNIYCKEDYYRLFSIKCCARCHLAISSNELVMRAREHVYHLHCFTCATCNKALTKGEYFGLKEDVIYCRLHYQMLVQYECPHDPYSPPGPTCSPSTPFDGAECSDGDCLRCLPADTHSYSLEYCPLPLTVPLFHATTTPQKGRPRKRKGVDLPGAIAREGEPTKKKRGRPKMVSIKSPVSELDVTAIENSACQVAQSVSLPTSLDLEQAASSESSTSGGSSCIVGHSASSRPKRMRTSFKHHQLRTMKSYFAINHNPDAKDLKQLSQKTGLSKRVLQVWFQNARAKWRRNLLRQQTQGPEIAQESKPLAELSSPSSGGLCEGVASSHPALSEMQGTPITQEEQNIQTYTNLL